MKHKKQRADKSRCSPVEQPTTSPNLAPHLEVFAGAVAEGYSHVQAAVMCGRARGSASFLFDQPGVQERIAELQTLAKNATEKEVAENAIRMIRPIDTDRNEIIMGLVDIAREKNAPYAARVRAWTVLTDIFMLRARTLRDISEYYGYTEDELEQATLDPNFIPERFRRALSKLANRQAGEQESLRTENLAGGPGETQVGGGSNP